MIGSGMCLLCGMALRDKEGSQFWCIAHSRCVVRVSAQPAVLWCTGACNAEASGRCFAKERVTVTSR